MHPYCLNGTEQTVVLLPKCKFTIHNPRCSYSIDDLKYMWTGWTEHCMPVTLNAQETSLGRSAACSNTTQHKTNPTFADKSLNIDVYPHSLSVLFSDTMMTSSNGNIFRVAGPLCGEVTGPGEFPAQRPVTRSFDVLLVYAWINDWVNNSEAGDLRRHRGHYDVNVMTMHDTTATTHHEIISLCGLLTTQIIKRDLLHLEMYNTAYLITLYVWCIIALWWWFCPCRVGGAVWNHTAWLFPLMPLPTLSLFYSYFLFGNEYRKTSLEKILGNFSFVSIWRSASCPRHWNQRWFGDAAFTIPSGKQWDHMSPWAPSWLSAGIDECCRSANESGHQWLKNSWLETIWH